MQGRSFHGQLGTLNVYPQMITGIIAALS